MAAPAHIARENGKKGGRPKGSKAAHTLKAEQALKNLIDLYVAECEPINKALIDKAKTGDVAAQKELRDRVHGKALQPIEGKLTGNLKLTFDSSFNVSPGTS